MNSGFQPRPEDHFTISPVRHLRDGFVENNRVRQQLIHAVHHLTEANDHGFIFPPPQAHHRRPADYRFFAEDMVHQLCRYQLCVGEIHHGLYR